MSQLSSSTSLTAIGSSEELPSEPAETVTSTLSESVLLMQAYQPKQYNFPVKEYSGVHKAATDCIDMCSVLREFISANDTRKTMFGPVIQ
jgi:hypothetical protein